ncbi:MAG TPA: circadian clock KaiB family protein [Longimicrobium sp.]|nr:circadian clock KaiB family protein [Longimicrobium sp.]
MDRIALTLFVAGPSPRSRAAESNLRAMCRDQLGGRAELKVIDVVQDPEAAERHRVLTTPTVVREHPAPPRRVTGDLGDAARVLAALDLETERQP